MQTSKDVSHLATYSIDDAIPSTFLYEPKEYANLIDIGYVEAICVKVNVNVFKFVTVTRNFVVDLYAKDLLNETTEQSNWNIRN